MLSLPNARRCFALAARAVRMDPPLVETTTRGRDDRAASHRHALMTIPRELTQTAYALRHPGQRSQHRPRTVLVLGGGGMRGMAHVGILRAMRTLGIEYDAIVGTSIG